MKRQSSAPQPPRVHLQPPEDDREHAANWNDPPARLSRSPRPYRRKARDYADQSTPPSRSNSYLPSPSLTPSASASASDIDLPLPSTTPLPDRFNSRPPSRLDLATPGESGAEGDDEGFQFIKALPPPPSRSNKGLREAEQQEAANNLISTDIISAKTDSRSQNDGKASSNERLPDLANPRTGAARGRLYQRLCEVACLGCIGYRVLPMRALESDPQTPTGSWILWYLGLLFLVITYLLALRLRLTPGTFITNAAILGKVDPAPILYPPLLPILLCASVQPSNSNALLLNMTLGLSTIPRRLTQSTSTDMGRSTTFWLISMIPSYIFCMSAQTMTHSTNQSANSGLYDCSMLYPLHQSLVAPLRYLTANSLLSSEIHLLSIALVNLLVLASSPQMLMMKYILWIGGLGIFFLCQQPLKWNVALERIPAWRFRRASVAIRATNTLLGSWQAKFRSSFHTEALASDEDLPSPSHNRRAPEMEASKPERKSNGMASTSPATLSPTKTKLHKRRKSSMHQYYLTLTATQVSLRKWAYAVYTYIVALVLIFGPIRIIVGRYALQNVDPFGWAISYLFGDITSVQEFTRDYPLRAWIPPAPFVPTVGPSTLLEYFQHPSPSLRRSLFLYWLLSVGTGVATVLVLSNHVEVDTRRKVFHFTMVALLLPTAYIDPCYLSLGLVLVLVIFLLLELMRAARLRPLAQPLAQFLTPYVDGRDLRGPIVVSHIFLLIGCAIPLWLSLAAIPAVPTEAPWNGWIVASGDVSMLAGVICVGMGDAAASLVGRAIGRHKWPWPGGKSLEGSAAFAIAVTMGLLLGKAWLVFGGWARFTESLTLTVMKSGAAASVASLTEAVLTGCNDNVVVPLVLWLAVRGFGV